MARKKAPQPQTTVKQYGKVKVTMKNITSAPGGPGWQVRARPPAPLPPGIIVTKAGERMPKVVMRRPQRRG